MDATPILGIPFAEGTDPADAPALSEAIALAIEELLLEIPATQIKGGVSGDLVVVQGTGAAAFKAMSGDVTIDSTGKTAIGLLKVVTGMLADLAVTSSKIDNSAVSAEKLANLAVTAAKLANEAVEEGKIKNKAVGTGKLADLGVTAAKLGEECVEESKIKNKAVGAGKLADLGVTTEKLAALAVTAAKIAEATITAAKIANNAVTAEKIIAGAITETKLADGAATSRKVKLTADEVLATGGLNLTEAFKDVPGASLAITPKVASTLMVTAFFDLEIHSEGGAAYAVGTVNVDGATLETAVNGIIPPGNNIIDRKTVGQTYAIPLTAAAHTVKLQAKKEGITAPSNNTCAEENTKFTYILVAS